MKHFISSESVTCGHPDKVCDQISDAILDACLAQDSESRVACECLATKEGIVLAGEITTTAHINYEQIARETIIGIGYDSPKSYFDGNTCQVLNYLHEQSDDIALGVDSGGAGDQGIMFGFACDETQVYMPATIFYAHQLAQQLEKVRRDGTLAYLMPDGKTQVTGEYQNRKLKRIDTVVISSQHTAEVDHKILEKGIIDTVITPIVGDMIDKETNIHINPTGQFIIGGPYGDSGLTGRKIIVDTYGGIARHGGGAFSGKDPSKVDRSAAYMARYLAKNIVASGICSTCEIQLAYAIGVAEPVSIFVDCFGTEKVAIRDIVAVLEENFDLTPTGIISFLNLKKPIYKATASYGHFGKNKFSWEKLDSVEVFKKLGE